MVGDCRFVVVGDEDGHLSCRNLSSIAELWSVHLHGGSLCGLVAVGAGRGERVLAVDRTGRCAVVDPSSGEIVSCWPVPGCDPRFPHRHAVGVSWDAEHVALSCLQPLPPGLVAVSDAAAAQGIVVNVHDSGGVVVLTDPTGRLLGQATVKRPFAVGAQTRLAYLRSPERWVGVRDVVSGDELGACPHCYERGGYAVAISPTDRWVAWSGYEKYTSSLETREFVRLVDLEYPDEMGRDVLRGDAEFTELAFSPAGDRLLVGDAEGGVTDVPLDDHAQPVILGAVEGGVAALGFAGDHAVAVGAEGELCCWRLRR